MNRRNPRPSRKNPAFTEDHHPMYSQWEGQFSTGEEFTHGVQPMNRRNPKSLENPRKRKASGGAAEAMELYHSGQADSLAEAWAMVKGEAVENPRKRKSASKHASKNVQVARFPGRCPECGEGFDRGEEIVDSGKRGPRGGVLMAHRNCG
jgi:hypothetical protein